MRRFIFRLATMPLVCMPLSARAADGPQSSTHVDLMLILAADVSRSIDADKYELQRKGYASAMSDPEVLRAIAAGPTGRNRGRLRGMGGGHIPETRDRLDGGRHRGRGAGVRRQGRGGAAVLHGPHRHWIGDRLFGRSLCGGARRGRAQDHRHFGRWRQQRRPRHQVGARRCLGAWRDRDQRHRDPERHERDRPISWPIPTRRAACRPTTGRT